MDRQRLINKLIQEELDRCKALYERLDEESSRLPHGSIVAGDGVLRHFFREDGKQHLRRIGADDRDLLCGLKKRRIMKKGMPALERRMKNCKRFLEMDEIYDPVVIAEALPEQYRNLTGVGVFFDEDINPDEWSIEEYSKGTMYRENLVHDDGSGIAVRSKSEAMIAMRLKENGLSFRYEPEVKLGMRSVFPDFGILLNKSRRVVYWEHLGMMGDPEYALKAIAKLEEYYKHGIFLGYNLVITCETKDRPLTVSGIDNIINQLLSMDNF